MINDIKQIDGYESLTAQQIADTLKATGVTRSPIDRATLVHLLNLRGMLRKIVGNNSDEKWTGSVLAMQDAILAMGSDDQKEAIRLWFSHITNPSNLKWDTTDGAFAVGFWQMFSAFADVHTMPSTADFEAIAELGGGWKFANVTAEDVTASLLEEQRLAMVDLANATIANRYNNAVASLGSEHTDGLDLAGLQSYCDAVVASVDGLVV